MSQYTDRGVFEIANSPLDDTNFEVTESHTVRVSNDSSVRKLFSLLFSTSQLIGKRKNILKKTKFVIELVDMEGAKILARSLPFTLANVLKTMNERMSMHS